MLHKQGTIANEHTSVAGKLPGLTLTFPAIRKKLGTLHLKADITDHALATFFKAVHQAQSHIPFPIPASLLEPVLQPAAPVETAPKAHGRPRKAQPATPRPSERRHWSAWSADQIDERLKKIVIEQLGVDESEVTPGASLVIDLNADSLDLVEYIISVEEIFQTPDSRLTR